MNLWIFAAIALGVIGIALLVAGAARRNRGGRRLCPRCRYDLSATLGPPCSECGYAWTAEDELRSKPASRSQRIAGMLALVLVLGIVVSLPLLTGRHWTHFIPQPVLTLALRLLVDEQPVAAGSLLPAPNQAFKHSRNRWERLVWQQQAARAIERFLDMVERSGGTLEDIERLLPAAREAHDVMKQAGSTDWADYWPLKQVIDRARECRAELDARFDLPLGTWAASELQFFDGLSETYSNWIAPPLEVHVPLSKSSDTVIRRYVFDRLMYLSAREASVVIEHMAEEDPNPTLRDDAARTLRWRRESRGWR